MNRYRPLQASRYCLDPEAYGPLSVVWLSNDVARNASIAPSVDAPRGAQHLSLVLNEEEARQERVPRRIVLR